MERDRQLGECENDQEKEMKGEQLDWLEMLTEETAEELADIMRKALDSERESNP